MDGNLTRDVARNDGVQLSYKRRTSHDRIIGSSIQCGNEYDFVDDKNMSYCGAAPWPPCPGTIKVRHDRDRMTNSNESTTNGDLESIRRSHKISHFHLDCARLQVVPDMSSELQQNISAHWCRSPAREDPLTIASTWGFSSTPSLTISLAPPRPSSAGWKTSLTLPIISISIRYWEKVLFNSFPL